MESVRNAPGVQTVFHPMPAANTVVAAGHPETPAISPGQFRASLAQAAGVGQRPGPRLNHDHSVLMAKTVKKTTRTSRVW